MSIKILGGVVKGIELTTPKSSLTRPTSVMLKRRLFDSIQNFSNKIFIDLCAGSGSMGIEALSRGAEKVYCVEQNQLALKALKQNQTKLKNYSVNSENLIITKSDVLKWMNEYLSQIISENNDNEIVIFFDPPYEKIELYKGFMEKISEYNNLKVVIEACQQKTMKLEEFLNLYPQESKVFKQGTSFFVIYDL